MNKQKMVKARLMCAATAFNPIETMAKKKYPNMSKENISRLTNLSDAVGAAILEPLQSETDLTLQEGLTCIAVGLMSVLDTLSEVIGEDPKDTLRTFIGALQDDLSRRP